MPIVWQARLAGIAYLLVIGGGLFAQAAVVEAVIVPGDAAETARAVAAHETLWRWGIAVHLAYLVLAVLADVLLYGFFRPVQATIARLALVFGVVSVASEAAILLTLYVPLALLDEGEALAALGTGSQEALAYLAISLYATGFGFPLLLFLGLLCLDRGADSAVPAHPASHRRVHDRRRSRVLREQSGRHCVPGPVGSARPLDPAASLHR
jgi:Domain of unknown function (DUF4386)